MKKTLLLFTVMLLCAAALMGAVTPVVNAQRDKVEVYEETVMGDPAAAEGLLVHMTAEYDRNLIWETDCIPGKDPVCETEYSFHQYGKNFIRRGDTQSFYISVTKSYGYDEDATRGLALAFRELYDSLEPGEDMEKTVYVKDYYDYYPISGHVDFEKDVYYWDYSNFDTMTEEEIAENTEDWVDVTIAMQEYFKIPVIEDETVDIHVSKVTVGDVAYSSGMGGSIDGDAFDMFSCHARTDDAVYFTFDAHTRNGDLVDVSEIKGGYGLYRLPVGATPDGTGEMAYYWDLELVAPLDPASEKVEMNMSSDEKTIFLHTRENGMYVVRVYDAATGEELQVLTPAPWSDDEYGWGVYEAEDFFAVKLTQDRIILFTENENGDYHTPIVCEIPYIDYYEYSFDRVSMDYDGERLAVVDKLFGDNFSWALLCGFSLTVYDEDGVAYLGRYTTSLGAGEVHLDSQYRCSVEGYPPCTVRFR